MAVKLLPREPAGLGLVTCCQARPFHRSISGLIPGAKKEPTAQALDLPAAATPFRRASGPPGLGLVTCAPPRPFHRSIRALIVLPVL
jgi:hypothetical protein